MGRRFNSIDPFHDVLRLLSMQSWKFLVAGIALLGGSLSGQAQEGKKDEANLKFGKV